jgi:hypothetical protein
VPEPRFFIGMVNERLVWEDTWFCQQVRKAGGMIIGDADVRFGHLGPRLMVNDATANSIRAQYLAENPDVAEFSMEVAK